jgi:Mn-dependent DtxR family transcriptional regulator
MNQTDDRVLELLDESGLKLNPSAIAVNLEYSRSWVSRRCKMLAEAELIEITEDSYYRITDRGRAYLTGELNADALARDEE